MKNSMVQICPVYNTNRMVREYTEQFYCPAMKKYQLLFRNNQKKTKELTTWKSNLLSNWQNIHFITVKEDGSRQYQVGSKIDIEAKISLGALKPEDISVEIYHGYVDNENNIINGSIEIMTCTEKKQDQVYVFTGSFPCHTSGLYGYTVRVIPQSENLTYRHETGLILWAND